MRLLMQLLPVVVISFIGGQGMMAVEDDPAPSLAIGVATAVLAVLVYALTVRWSERRSPSEVAVKGATSHTVVGLVIGLGWFGAVIGHIALMDGYRVDGTGSLSGPVGLFGFMAAASVTEELMFRGVLFRFTERRFGTWFALALTSVLFGAWHLVNPDASLLGAAAVTFSAGLLLPAVYAATRTLWMPIGVHFGWNYAASAIFGTEVSGNGDNDGFLHGVTSGPDLLTGGRFGPEASPYTVAFGLVLTVVFLWIARRRGNLVSRRRRAPATPTATLAQ